MSNPPASSPVTSGFLFIMHWFRHLAVGLSICDHSSDLIFFRVARLVLVLCALPSTTDSVQAISILDAVNSSPLEFPLDATSEASNLKS
ncbi:hypothetical protein GGR57DRAFT_22926 [Xylariaceae sp. FL1272]|nr:hypothetical protein GGR57DRAFT_22926 [Xylariaceae sp. FL1272]